MTERFRLQPYEEDDAHNVILVELEGSRYAKIRILNDEALKAADAHNVCVHCISYKILTDCYVFLLR